MRMMFIVLIWALAAFTSAQSTNKIQIKRNCGGVFDCYVPKNCEDHDIAIGNSIFTHVKQATDKIFDDCPSIIRFHVYAKHLLAVRIESLTKNTNSIILTHKEFKIGGGGDMKSQFSCKRSNGMLERKHRVRVPKQGDPLNFLDTSFELIPEVNPEMLDCEFEVELDEDKDVFYNADYNDVLSLDIDGVKTDEITSSSIVLSANAKCDPSKFEFLLPEIPERLHKFDSVKHKPGEYFCNTNYKMQYLQPPGSVYIDVQDKKLECVNKQFTVNGGPPIPPDYYLKIRCIADAKYFCNFDGKARSGEIGPSREGLELKCPLDLPHLIIEKQPFINPKFKCENFGNKFVWTVEGTMGTQIKTSYFTKERPEVYCTNEVKCQTMFAITKSIVDKGTLDKNFLPICFGDGELTIDNKNVTAKRCDKLSGKYKYTVDGEEKDITSDTKFKCIYKMHTSDSKNAQNNKKIAIGIASGVGVCVGLLLLIAVLIAGVTSFCVKREQRRIAKTIGKDYKQYAMNSGEKAAAELKPSKWKKNKKQQIQQKPQPSSSEKPVPIDTWNDMIQFLRKKCANGILGPNESCPVNSQELPEVSVTDEMLKQCGPIPKNSKKATCERNGSEVVNKMAELYHSVKLRKEKDKQVAIKEKERNKRNKKK